VREEREEKESEREVLMTIKREERERERKGARRGEGEGKGRKDYLNYRQHGQTSTGAAEDDWSSGAVVLRGCGRKMARRRAVNAERKGFVYRVRSRDAFQI
jgi:hypothetical protein